PRRPARAAHDPSAARDAEPRNTAVGIRSRGRRRRRARFAGRHARRRRLPRVRRRDGNGARRAGRRDRLMSTVHAGARLLRLAVRGEGWRVGGGLLLLVAATITALLQPWPLKVAADS